MATFYSEHNLRRQLSAPQFTRTRHRFRGPRESEKINLEMDQLYYSLNKLAITQDEFQDRFIDKASTILGGGPIEGVEYELENVVISGLEDLAHKLDTLKRRVEALEA